MEDSNKSLKWFVTFSSSAAKQVKNLPSFIHEILVSLALELEIRGPIRKDRKNFGSLWDGTYHCHLKKGHPTYVACWKIIDKKLKKVEIFYVGTHEKAPY
jgi:mRNA-degrading endonuclease RelE of RelBE toxin-antitoxin system